MNEIAALAIAPHFDAVRDVFVRHRAGGAPLSRIKRVKLIVDERARRAPRNYAACREDGGVIMIAPQAAEELDIEVLLAIITHEFGHAADFLYPAHWRCRKNSPAIWREPSSRHLREWNRRSHSQIEDDADSIAYAVTGHRIGYCGECLLQCFGGISRPEDLR